MKIIKSFKILNKEINFNENIGFIPTMGALHMGHISLINIAKKKTKKIIVSIFINPSQFNEKKDYSDLIKSIKTLNINDSKLNNYKDIKQIDDHIIESMIKRFFSNA